MKTTCDSLQSDDEAKSKFHMRQLLAFRQIVRINPVSADKNHQRLHFDVHSWKFT